MHSIAIIDIGTTKAVTVITEMDNTGHPRVVGVGKAPCKGLKKGSVVDTKETTQGVVASIRQAEQMANKKIHRVIASVTGAHIEGVNSTGIVPILPPARQITREDVHRVINHSKQIAIDQDKELIMAVPRTFKVDGLDGVSRPYGMNGGRLEVSTLLVTGTTSHLNNLQECIERAQLEVECLVPMAMAAGTGVLSENEMEIGTAVADIGGGTTDIAIFVDGSVAHIRMIPLGSQHATSDISILLKTSIEEAEKLKIQNATCAPEMVMQGEAVEVHQDGNGKARPFDRSVLAQIVEARFREILKLVKDEIETSGLADKIPGGIVFTGAGSKINHLEILTTKIFGDTPTRIGNPKQLHGLGDMIAGPEYAAAVGLVKYGARMKEEQTVTAEEGDWKQVFKKIGSFLSPRAKENIK